MGETKLELAAVKRGRKWKAYQFILWEISFYYKKSCHTIKFPVSHSFCQRTGTTSFLKELSLR